MKITRSETITRQLDVGPDDAIAELFVSNAVYGVDTITLYGRLEDGTSRIIEYRKVEEEA